MFGGGPDKPRLPPAPLEADYFFYFIIYLLVLCFYCPLVLFCIVFLFPLNMFEENRIFFFKFKIYHTAAASTKCCCSQSPPHHPESGTHYNSPQIPPLASFEPEN